VSPVNTAPAVCASQPAVTETIYVTLGCDQCTYSFMALPTSSSAAVAAPYPTAAGNGTMASSVRTGTTSYSVAHVTGSPTLPSVAQQTTNAGVAVKPFVGLVGAVMALALLL